jgi:hypothetical protein
VACSVSSARRPTISGFALDGPAALNIRAALGDRRATPTTARLIANMVCAKLKEKNVRRLGSACNQRSGLSGTEGAPFGCRCRRDVPVRPCTPHGRTCVPSPFSFRPVVFERGKGRRRNLYLIAAKNTAHRLSRSVPPFKNE